MYVFLRTTTSNSTPTFRRPVSVCKPVFLWGAKVSFSSLIEKKGVFKIYFVNTVLQFAKSLRQNILALLENHILSKQTYAMDAKYYITLDKEPPLFKPRRGSKKTQPEHDTLPKTMSETYFSAQ